MTRMQILRRRIAQLATVPGVIEAPRDLFVLVGGAIAIVLAIAILVSPAAAIYLLARHVGLAMLEAAIVTLGLVVALVGVSA